MCTCCWHVAKGPFCTFCPLNKTNTALAIEVLLQCYLHWSHMYIFHTPAMKTKYILHFASCCILVTGAGDKLLSPRDWVLRCLCGPEPLVIFVEWGNFGRLANVCCFLSYSILTLRISVLLWNLCTNSEEIHKSICSHIWSVVSESVKLYCFEKP
jgi:hypothetical protein